MSLVDKDIFLWTVQFDNDDFIYSYLQHTQVLNAIEVFADINLKKLPNKTEIINQVLEYFNDFTKNNKTCLSAKMSIDKHLVYIRRIPIDKHSPIHKALSLSYNQVDEKTKKLIEFCFNNPNC